MFIQWYFDKSNTLFQSMTMRLETEKLTDSEAIAYVQYLIHIAKATNLYSSPSIEKALCKIAERIGNDIDISHDYDKNKVLHVASLLRSYGGHTQLITRWIRFDSHYSNDVAILDSFSEIPDKLMQESGLKGTKIWVCDKQGPIEKAIWLRELASKYEYVVLHVHHPEVVHVLAFGTKSFRRPVLYMNHTDHLFWVGLSISDAILNMSTRAKAFTANRRGRDDGFVLPIPLDRTVSGELEKDKARTSLGIAKDAKVLMSCGSFYKYSPISFKKSFFWLMMKILSARKDIVAVIVGIKPSSILWSTLKLLFRDRLLLKETCAHHELHAVLIASDVYVDSYPLSGFTTLCEAMMNDTPIVPIDTGSAFYDALLDNCVPFEEVEDRINLLLSNSAKVDGLGKLHEHTKEEWVRNLHDVISRVSKEHKIWDISTRSVNLQEIDKTLYYQYAGQLISFTLLRRKIPIALKMKVIMIYLKNCHYTAMSVLLRLRSLFFKVISQ